MLNPFPLPYAKGGEFFSLSTLPNLFSSQGSFFLDIQLRSSYIGLTPSEFLSLLGVKVADGIHLRFDNDQAMIAALKKLVSQEGFGKQPAKGTTRA